MANSFYPQLTELQLSESSREVLHGCPRKLEFRKFYQHSSSTETLPTGAGHALHAGYQEWMVSRDETKAIYAMMDRYPIKFATTPNASRSLEACYATLLAMIGNQSLQRYELCTFVVDGVSHPAIEVPFRLLIKDYNLDDNTPIVYVGYIDLVLFDRYTNEYVIVDIKTTTYSLADLTPKYKFDNQCVPYAMVLQRLLKSEKAISIQELQVKYLVVHIDILEPHVRMYEFDKSAIDVNDWARGFVKDLHDLKMYYQSGWFPRRGSSCLSWGKTCTHFLYCSTRDHATIEKMLELEPKYEGKPIEPWIEIDLYLEKAR